MARVRRRRAAIQHARIDDDARAVMTLLREVTRARFATIEPGSASPWARSERWWAEVGHPASELSRGSRWVDGAWVHDPRLVRLARSVGA